MSEDKIVSKKKSGKCVTCTNNFQEGVWSILELSKQYPNDFELGEQVRFLYNNYIKE